MPAVGKEFLVRTCSVDTCEQPVRAKRYCYAHYMKAWRYGTPTPQHPSRRTDLTGHTFGQLTVLSHHQRNQWLCRCECGATTIVRTGDLNRGTITSCGNRAIHRRRDSVEYNAVHYRLRNDFGKASNHPCSDCQNPADHWSYNYDDPEEARSEKPSSIGLAYSLKPEHYSARCAACHKR